MLYKLADGSLTRLRARTGFRVGVRVVVPPFPYREDIGDRWSEEDSDRLHAWGYLRE